MSKVVAYLLTGGALLAIAASGVGQGSATYVGVGNCKTCHADKYKAWAKTKHARVFKLLELANQTTNPECLKCHVTGYGDGGYKQPAQGENPDPDFAGVTCEVCHGKGSEHNGDKANIVKAPSVTVCMGCHKEAAHPEATD